MILDPSTIAGVTAAACGALATALWMASAQQAPALRGALRLWSCGLVAGPLGWLLLEWADAAPVRPLAVPGKTLMIAACALQVRALLKLQERPSHDTVLAACVAAVALLTLAYALLWPAQPMRTALLSLGCAGLCLWGLRITLHDAAAHGGARIVAAAFGLSALAWLVRAALLYMPEASAARHLIASDEAQSLTLGLALLLPSAGTLGIVLMGNERLLARLAHIAAHDGLTGTLTRLPFLEHLEHALRVDRADAPLAVLLLDIDHFKQVNDGFGHDIGDRALRLVADAVRHELRQSDLLCRYGGEEFAVLMHDADAAQATRVARRINQSVAQIALLAGGQAVPLRVSVGVASAWPGLREAAPLLRRADLAMYAAKAAGRNRVHVAEAPASG